MHASQGDALCTRTLAAQAPALRGALELQHGQLGAAAVPMAWRLSAAHRLSACPVCCRRGWGCSGAGGGSAGAACRTGEGSTLQVCRV